MTHFQITCEAADDNTTVAIVCIDSPAWCDVIEVGVTAEDLDQVGDNHSIARIPAQTRPGDRIRVATIEVISDPHATLA